jgi:hypothetical protein
MGSKAFPPPKLLLPTFTPLCLASSTFNTRISVRVCVEGENVCRHDTSMQNYCLLEQRRPHDTILYWYDPAVVSALPFKYTESIVSAASALNCAKRHCARKRHSASGRGPLCDNGCCQFVCDVASTEPRELGCPLEEI